LEGGFESGFLVDGGAREEVLQGVSEVGGGGGVLAELELGDA